MKRPVPPLATDFSRPPPLPRLARDRAEALMRSGYLHRYREGGSAHDDVATFEAVIASMLGARYAVAVNSCGSALFLSLISAGLERGEPVLMNAFTLGPVPGAVVHAGGRPVLVEINDDLVIDCDDLIDKARSSGARFLLLSHMRGHIADMEHVKAVCSQLGLVMIEDCAHTLGASFAGRPAGRFGMAGCFSLQSYKHVNAGEGGVIVTDDADLAARAILHSGSYMLYAQNGSRPDAATFEKWRHRCANFSMRMSNLTAALASPQLKEIDERRAIWNASHDRLAEGLGAIDGIRLPTRHRKESYCQSSIQFMVGDRLERAQIPLFIARCHRGGVPLKWFGAADAIGYTSRPDHWHYLGDVRTPPRTQAILGALMDLRIPLGLAPDECDAIVGVISDSLADAELERPADSVGSIDEAIGDRP